MARLEERLDDAQAALATLEELANRDGLSIAERDGAILRFVYTFEAVWKAAALLLEQNEGIAVGSPKGAIRASRRAKLLSDDDAEEAGKLADDRNLTVHMYKQNIGDAIAERLAGHAALLRRWLDALRERVGDGT
ncbi:MAG TPA: nucleotidyltransferase substrate binding protein [Stellaceae bacterium]|nr:nucleotidyltransferase substrate binding protein [Stellaceae bacterium]